MFVKEMKGASIVIEDCARVEAGERVLVVADWKTSEIGERVAAAARERDAETSFVLMDPREYDGNEPPDPVAGAMMRADVLILCTYRSIGHSEATKRAKENGARSISMVKMTKEQLVDGGLYADYEEMRPKCDAVAEKFTEADTATVTSSKGTDLTFDLEGRSGNSHPGIVEEAGKSTGLVHIEANISPVEGTTSGEVVFDGAIPNLDIGVLEEDVYMEIEEGKVVTVEGGNEAAKIRRVWNEQNDPAVYNIAQLAVGMNPECKEFNDWFSHNHGRYGNVHLGIGTSSNLGGTTRAPVHFDAMMAEPTLFLDDEKIVEEGDVVYP